MQIGCPTRLPAAGSRPSARGSRFATGANVVEGTHDGQAHPPRLREWAKCLLGGELGCAINLARRDRRDFVLCMGRRPIHETAAHEQQSTTRRVLSKARQSVGRSCHADAHGRRQGFAAAAFGDPGQVVDDLRPRGADCRVQRLAISNVDTDYLIGVGIGTGPKLGPTPATTPSPLSTRCLHSHLPANPSAPTTSARMSYAGPPPVEDATRRRATSASTIMRISSSNLTVGSHPSASRAREESPRKSCTSLGRMLASSTST